MVSYGGGGGRGSEGIAGFEKINAGTKKFDISNNFQFCVCTDRPTDRPTDRQSIFTSPHTRGTFNFRNKLFTATQRHNAKIITNLRLTDRYNIQFSNTTSPRPCPFYFSEVDRGLDCCRAANSFAPTNHGSREQDSCLVSNRSCDEFL